MNRTSPAHHRLRRPPPFRLEPLEPRIVPSALNVTLGGTATTLIDRGDTGDANGMTIVTVNSGKALVYVTDLNSDGVYQDGEITGIAVSDKIKLGVNGTVNGDIVTNLDSDGTLSDGTMANDGTELLDANISSLIVTGSVNQILAGHDLTNVSVASATEIRNGTAAGARMISFPAGAPVMLLAFAPEPGDDGGRMDNILVSAGTGDLTIALGDGGDSTDKNGGDAGDCKNLTITTAGNVTIITGSGGDGFKRGGNGTECEEFSITSTGGNVVIDAGAGGSILDLPGAKGRGGNAGFFMNGDLEAAGDVSMNTSGGLGGNATKQAGQGSYIEAVNVIAGGDILLIGTNGGSTPDTANLDGEKGSGGLGGHVTGKLNVFADLTILDAGGTVTILTGSGGSGGRFGNYGGGVFGFDITAGDDVTVTSGNGATYDPINTASEKGTGGLGGEINSLIITTPGNVVLTAGNGGGGSSVGNNGGSIGFIQIIEANDVTFTAGNGGGFTSAMFSDDENTETGGAGGGLFNNRIGGLPGNSITGNVTLTAGNGYGNTLDVRRGGPGGSIFDLVVATAGNLVLNAGSGGQADTTNHNGTSGGQGGHAEQFELTGADITVTAGVGGVGINGGHGGRLDDGTLDVSGEANLAAGNGGDGISTGQYSAKDGGDGGDVKKFVISGTGFVRSIVAGSGGMGNKDGDGGTIENITFDGGTIGDFSGAYGVAGMGGLFAGSGDTAGDVISVHAARISNIVAGTGAIPVPAHTIQDIVATAVAEGIGSDLNDNGKFDFLDLGGTVGAYDPTTDQPIDGLVLAESLGTITGATLYTLETSTGDSTGMVQPN
jgi:hypothetical protein